MKVIPIPAFDDNYIWLLIEQGRAIVVDPGQSSQVIDYLTKHQLTLDAIWLTHDHADHTDGVQALAQAYPHVPIYGPSETQAEATHLVKDGQIIGWRGHPVRIIASPGHTAGHISYLIDGHLFCGDALFSAGCGRVFTQDYQAEFNTLKRFTALPNDTLVYAGHEYTLTNLEFAHQIAPKNQAIADALKTVTQLRRNNEITLPTTIGREKLINLLMMSTSVHKFKQLRDQRDQF